MMNSNNTFTQITTGFSVVFLMSFLGFAHLPQTSSSLTPKKLKGGQIIDDRIGASIPMDITLTNHMGEKIALKNYFDTKKPRPVILVLGYYGCKMLCHFVSEGLIKTLKETPLKIGNDYTVISVSIDPKEKHERAKNRRDFYLKKLLQGNEDIANMDWHFHVTTKKQIERLTKAVGFGYRFDRESGQYAHGAGIFIISPDGKLNRILYGIEFSPSDMKLALTEASSSKASRLFERIILSCFHYDPSSHRYGIYIFGITRLLGIITMLSLIASLFFLLIREQSEPKKRRR